MGSERPPLAEVPETLLSPDGCRYIKGKFLGKGGFARCYELKDSTSGLIHAGKIVSKTLLQKKHQKEKMTQEIAIHRALQHPHVVGFTKHFEDAANVYILLELCKRRSLMELHKRRRAITEPEARYFTSQIVDGVSYLHDKGIIHRDLKLGNLFLNDEMDVKIGDFGLATQVDDPTERKKTLCGTPNYIAPEMLNKRGHSFEVDIWAIGCILFTLLVGKPPFETQSLKETYAKIKKNEYHTPSRVSPPAKELIAKLLAPEPQQRPTIGQIHSYAFFSSGYHPKKLPTSCLTMAPKFPASNAAPPSVTPIRRVLSNVQEGNLSPSQQVKKDIAAQSRPLGPVPENGLFNAAAASVASAGNPSADVPSDFYLRDLFSQLDALVKANPADNGIGKREGGADEELVSPEAAPVFWVGKWVDYSDKYGLGYQLCDNSVGVLFNDTTKLVLDSAGEQVQYVTREGQEFYYTITSYPTDLNKKIVLLRYFRNYMNEHLLKAGAGMAPREGDELARLPCLRTWFRTKSAIILHLTNGSLQVNFFADHAKLIICPLMGAVTLMDKDVFKTYLLANLKAGCSQELLQRIRYCRTMVERLLTHSATSIRPGSSKVSTSTASSANGLSGPSASAASAPTPTSQPLPNHALTRQATGLPPFKAP